MAITSQIYCSTSFLPLSPCWLMSIKMSNVFVIHVPHCPCNVLKKIKFSNIHCYVAQRLKSIVSYFCLLFLILYHLICYRTNISKKFIFLGMEFHCPSSCRLCSMHELLLIVFLSCPYSCV